MPCEDNEQIVQKGHWVWDLEVFIDIWKSSLHDKMRGGTHNRKGRSNDIGERLKRSRDY
jgi:hypothetical protein